MKATIDPTDIARQVRDARRGSQAAFAWLHRAFAPLVHAIHLGVTSRARAEELTQETFVIAFGRLAQLREPASFGPWIAMIARRNRAVSGVEEGDLAEAVDPACRGEGPDSAAPAIRALNDYGVAVKVLTGDNPIITSKVCRDVGLNPGVPLLGKDIEVMDDVALCTVVKHTTIFAKLTPLQKSRVVKASTTPRRCGMRMWGSRWTAAPTSPRRRPTSSCWRRA